MTLQNKLIQPKIKMVQTLRTKHHPEVRMILVVPIVKIRIIILQAKIKRIKTVLKITQRQKIILQINHKIN